MSPELLVQMHKHAMRRESADDEIRVEYPRINVVGVGTAGCRVLAHLHSRSSREWSGVAVNTYHECCTCGDADRKILVDEHLTRDQNKIFLPLGTERFEWVSKPVFKTIFNNTDIIVFLSALGKGIETNIPVGIARFAKAMNIPTISLVIHTFQSNGAEIIELPSTGMKRLSRYVSYMHVLNEGNSVRSVNTMLTIEYLFSRLEVLVADCADHILNDMINRISVLVNRQNIRYINVKEIKRTLQRY